MSLHCLCVTKHQWLILPECLGECVGGGVDEVCGGGGVSEIGGVDEVCGWKV